MVTGLPNTVHRPLSQSCAVATVRAYPRGQAANFLIVLQVWSQHATTFQALSVHIIKLYINVFITHYFR